MSDTPQKQEVVTLNALSAHQALEEELAEVDHALSGCGGRVVREGFAMVREVAKEELRDPVW